MRECKLTTTSHHADELGDELSLFGAVAVTAESADQQEIIEPAPNSEILWDNTKLTALFQAEQITPALMAILQTWQNQRKISSCTFVDVAEQDWVRVCLDRFEPLKFGTKLWICPSWHTPPDRDAINVMFDPGLAFGTGTHPTTALCLEWLAENIAGDETIVDYGCGSGILAIAALRLGATHALAIDYDTQALTASANNAALNQISASQLGIYSPENAPLQSADIVIANIIAKPLIELAQRISAYVGSGGRLVLSGILQEQIDSVLHAYSHQFNLLSVQNNQNWIRLVLQKKT